MKRRLCNVNEDEYCKKRKILGGGVIGLAIIGSLLLNGCGSEEPGEEIVLETRIAPVKYNRDAIVTIMSDDGAYETGVMLDRLGAKYQFKITVSGIVSYIKPYLREWKKLERKGNLELISHSYTHLKMNEDADISEKDLKHEITDSIRFFKRYFRTDQVAFTPPENQMCEKGYEILADNGIRVMRQGQRGYNMLELQDGHEIGQAYNLYTFGIRDVDTTGERNAWVDEAVKNRAWLIEMWHDVTEDGDGGLYQEMAYDAADDHLAYIAAKQKEGEIWVASMVEATKYLLERDQATVSALYSDSKIRVTLFCNADKLATDIYRDPLTVRIMLPEAMMDFTEAVSSDRKNKIRFCEEHDKIYLEFEMIPNGKDVTIKLKK